jgi:hypothetical protein
VRETPPPELAERTGSEELDRRPAASDSGRARHRASASLRSRAQLRRSGSVLALYLAIAFLFLGLPALLAPHPSLIGYGADPGVHVWFLAWWPHAITHHLNPFVSHFVWAPTGSNVVAATSDAGPSLLLWPVTAIGGPVLSYNVLMTVAPAISAWAAYLLCRDLTGKEGAALVGGYLFGFSTYQIGHLMGHPNLVLVPLVPLMVRLAVAHVAGRMQARRFVVLLAACIIGQFLISTEVLLTFTLFAFVFIGLGLLMLGPATRKPLARLVPRVLLAYGLAAIPLAPFLFYAVQGALRSPIYDFYPSYYVIDGTNFLTPTSITALGWRPFAALSTKFTGNLAEGVGYVGPGLLAVALLAVASQWRRPAIRFLAAGLVVVMVASLGPRLHVAGVSTIPLPWRAVGVLPFVRYALPARFMLYAFLILAILTAVWLAVPGKGPPWAKWAPVALAAVLLFPNLGGNFWRRTVDTPAFFTTGAYRSALRPEENVLVIPFGDRGDSMMWQAQSGFYFRMPEGYLAVVPPPEFRDEPILQALYDQSLTADDGAELIRFLDSRAVTAVLVVGGTEAFRSTLSALLGSSGSMVGGVLLYRLQGRD